MFTVSEIEQKGLSKWSKLFKKSWAKGQKSNFLDHFQSSTVNNKKYYLEVMKHSYDFPTLCCKIIN